MELDYLSRGAIVLMVESTCEEVATDRATLIVQSAKPMDGDSLTE